MTTTEQKTRIASAILSNAQLLIPQVEDLTQIGEYIDLCNQRRSPDKEQTKTVVSENITGIETVALQNEYLAVCVSELTRKIMEKL